MESDKKDLTIIILSVLVGASFFSLYLLQLTPGNIPPSYPPNYAVVIEYDHNPAAPLYSYETICKVKTLINQFIK